MEESGKRKAEKKAGRKDFFGAVIRAPHQVRDKLRPESSL